MINFSSNSKSDTRKSHMTGQRPRMFLKNRWHFIKNSWIKLISRKVCTPILPISCTHSSLTSKVRSKILINTKSKLFWPMSIYRQNSKNKPNSSYRAIKLFLLLIFNSMRYQRNASGIATRICPRTTGSSLMLISGLSHQKNLNLRTLKTKALIGWKSHWQMDRVLTLERKACFSADKLRSKVKSKSSRLLEEMKS